MERRSLEGLIVLVLNFTGDSHDDDHEKKALEYLCSKKCDISREIYQAAENSDHATWTHNFISAASAAKHPQSTRLGRFYGSLYCTEVGDCVRLLKSGKNAISDQEIHRLWDSIGIITHQEDPMDLDPARTLSPNAWKVLAEKKKNFRVEQSFVRNMIDLMLCKYNSSHTTEPVYRLHAICGAATSSSCSGLICFHVNFLARTSQSSGCVLFFSEFFANLTLNEECVVNFISDKMRPFFCWPVSMLKSSNLCRCCLCEKTGSNILHPDSKDYVSSNGEDRTHSLPILNKMDDYTIDVDKALDTEFLYFDHEKDRHLTHLLEDTLK